MSNAQETGQAKAAVTETAAPSFLQRAISATQQTKPDRLKDLLGTLTEAAMSGTVKFEKNLTVTLKEAVRQLDERISTQLAAVMHDPAFLKLEGTWRGLKYLVDNTDSASDLKIRVLNATKEELTKDFEKPESALYREVYQEEFGKPGGKPYACMIGDYYFDNGPEDVELLKKIGSIASDAFCPFISATAPAMFGKASFTNFADGKKVAAQFDNPQWIEWNNFRKTPAAAFVTLTCPRVLARLPYGSRTKKIDSFGYEEAPFDAQGNAKSLEHDQYSWMNAAYALGTRLTNAYSEYGWCTAIRGAEGGGKVENLPTHVFKTDDGDDDAKCPTEIGFTDARDKELSDLGFMPLCHYKNENYAVFFSGQTIKEPETFDNDPDADANAKITARLPYVMATSRFAHYLKVMARDKIGSFMEVEDCAKWLQDWIGGYVNATDGAGQESRAKFPLREAKISVSEVPGSPGEYAATAWLRPWLQFEALSTSMRLVAKIPKKA